MQRNAIKNVGDVIKAHTTEKTLDELAAQGKKRVRVVSGQRVMEIIQAIVDDAPVVFMEHRQPLGIQRVAVGWLLEPDVQS